LKYCIVIMDGAAGWELPERNNQTCLELAKTPNLDAIARESKVGLTRTVPPGMEPSSACACMSVLGYNPAVYYKGRSAIEAKSMGIPISSEEIAFRCNLVAVKDEKMWSYSAGYISTPEAREIIESLDKQLGSDVIHFYPGVSYRHILKVQGHKEVLKAVCTPPHDISNKPIADYLPKGPGSEFLKDLMKRSEEILRDHPVNIARKSRGEIPATTLWLFWSSGQIPDMPPFQQYYGLNAAMTSAVDLLRGLAKMAGMTVLEIPGVTDSLDNDFAGQVKGALKALKNHELVVIHIEAPDEAGHAGSIEKKVEAIEKIDHEVIKQLRLWHDDSLRVLIMPDHPTPIKSQTHNDEPVPFLIWGPGFSTNGAKRFTERDAKYTKLVIENGYDIMKYFLKQGQ
jgi:2,3-bisphosphoglycerate-independent phosphoglycerate mutase